jgi:hypothetical protein
MHGSAPLLQRLFAAWRTPTRGRCSLSDGIWIAPALGWCVEAQNSVSSLRGNEQLPCRCPLARLLCGPLTGQAARPSAPDTDRRRPRTRNRGAASELVPRRRFPSGAEAFRRTRRRTEYGVGRLHMRERPVSAKGSIAVDAIQSIEEGVPCPWYSTPYHIALLYGLWGTTSICVWTNPINRLPILYYRVLGTYCAST